MGPWADLPATIGILFAAVARPCRRLLRFLCIGTGSIAIVMVVLAFTRIPFDVHRWLGTAAGKCGSTVDMIVVLGGSGMPSGPELLRLHHAARLAVEWEQAALVVIHPGEPLVMRSMVDELVLRGVRLDRIDTLNAGNNTREQAVLLKARLKHPAAIAIVTAPENMFRSVRAFRSVGFAQVCGAPAWDQAMFHDFDYQHRAIGGRAWVPDVSERPDLRYTFWNYLKLEVTCLREVAAIAYYRLNGWI